MLALGSSVNINDASTATLSNAGTMSPGGTGSIGTTSLTAGNVTQTKFGTYWVDLTLASNSNVTTADLIEIANSANVTLSGNVTPNVVGVNAATSGDSGTIEILSGSSLASFDTSSLTVADTATVDYSLTTSGDDLYLSYAIDYSGDCPGATLGENARSFGQNLDTLISFANANLTDGSAEQQVFQTFVNSVLNATDAGVLEDIYDAFTLDEAGVGVLGSLGSTFAMHGFLQSCPQLQATPQDSFYHQQECLWAQPVGSFTHQDKTGSNPGYDETGTGLAAGFQKEIGDDLFLEIAGHGEGVWVDGSNFTQNGYRLGGGAALKKEIGRYTLVDDAERRHLRLRLQAQLYDRPRHVHRQERARRALPGGGGAHHGSVREAGLLCQAGRGGCGDADLAGCLHRDGRGLLDQHVDAISKTNVALRPSLELGTAFDIRSMAATAFVRGGVTAFVTDPDVSVTSSFADLGAGFPEMTAKLSQDRLYGELEAGFNVMVSDRVSIGLKARGTLSKNSHSIAGEGRVRIHY